MRLHSDRQPSTLDPRLCLRGMTLIELLVVIVILTTLFGAAIPLLSPTNEDRRLREASRGANAFISGAQMRAIELQRPFGVGFKRLGQDTSRSEDNGLSLEIFYVEQPSPFVGFDETSAAMVAISQSGDGIQIAVRFIRQGNDQTQSSDRLPVGWDFDPIPPNTIRPGDVVVVNGNQYQLIDTGDNGAYLDANGFYESDAGVTGGEIRGLATRPVNDTGQLLNPRYDDDGNVLGTTFSPPEEPYWTYPSRYQVLRQPMPLGEPFQLPEGTAIDLRASGERIVIDESRPAPQRRVEGEFGGFFYNPDVLVAAERVNNSDPVIVMFSPEGSVERVKFNRRNMFLSSPEANEPFDAPLVSNIYLLIGRPESFPPLAADDPTLNTAALRTMNDEQLADAKQAINWLAGESRWIVIGAQSGRVVTVENAFLGKLQLAGDQTEPADVRRARQIDAAREFTRQMAQLGGR